MEEKCSLCGIKKETEWFYKDDKWVVCLCSTCKKPMAVYREHTMFVPILEISKITNIMKGLFGDRIILRLKQRTVFNHFHTHVYKEKIE